MTKSKYGDLIRKAREPENQQTVQPDDQTIQLESQQDKKPDDQINSQPDREVNLCVKVPQRLRRHWAAESKRQGVTMTLGDYSSPDAIASVLQLDTQAR